MLGEKAHTLPTLSLVDGVLHPFKKTGALHRHRHQLGSLLQHAAQTGSVRPLLRILLETSLQGFIQCLRQVRAGTSETLEHHTRCASEQFRRLLPARRIGTGEALIEGQRERVDVGLGVHILALELLRGHVRQGSHQITILGDGGEILQLRHAEVHDADVHVIAIEQHDVLGLDVAVYHAALVRMFQGAAHLDARLHQLRIGGLTPEKSWRSVCPAHTR